MDFEKEIKLSELKKCSGPELVKMLNGSLERLFKYQIGKVTLGEKNSHMKKSLKKNVARINFLIKGN